MHPLPPSPALIRMIASSINMLSILIVQAKEGIRRAEQAGRGRAINVRFGPKYFYFGFFVLCVRADLICPVNLNKVLSTPLTVSFMPGKAAIALAVRPLR